VNQAHSIRTYLTLSHVAIVTVSLTLMGLISLNHQQTEITEDLQMQMLNRVDSLAGMVAKDPNLRVDSEFTVLEIPGVHLEGYLTIVYIDSNQQVHNLTDSPIDAPLRQSISEISRESVGSHAGVAEIIERPGQYKQMYAWAQITTEEQDQDGILCLLMPLTAVQEFINRQRMIFGGMILGLSLVGMLASVLLTRPLAERVADVRQLAATVMQARYQMHVPETGPREIREISRSLNEMVDKLNEQEHERRTILSNVTHELGRPLAGIRLGVESLQKGALSSPELAEDLLGGMGQAIQQMELLLDDISLAIAPMGQTVKLHRSYISAQPFLQGIASRFWTMAETRGVKIRVNVPPDLPQVFADEGRLTQILGNLVHNAIKFTPRSQSIDLTAEAGNHNTVRLIVRDRGPGLQEGETDQLFTPFFQGEHGQRIKQGMGLGLSIARQLARLHGGDLEMANHPAGGTVAIVIMPAEPID
jgi:signal transduction histidine kinase